MIRARNFMVLVVGLAATAGLVADAAINLRNTSSDRPLILDQDTDYILRNVMATGMRDSAALTLTGRIKSVTIHRSSFGNVRAGEDGRAAGLMCSGASVGTLVANDSIFFDAENQLVSLKEGNFGLVSFRGCTFRTSDRFLKELYAANSWRDWPPVTEFYNIERLELLDNTFENTIVVIHPSVRQVVIRGEIPGLQVEDPASTQVLKMDADAVPAPIAGGANPIVIGTPWE